MKKIISLCITTLILLGVTGCPGISATDKKAQQELLAWIQQQDRDGWTIIGYENQAGFYKNVVLKVELKPAKVNIAIDRNSMNPYHQRNFMETIVRKWRDFYPVNMRPRFNLRVTLYDKEIQHQNELGFSEIDKDGNVDTHHGQTQDIM